MVRHLFPMLAQMVTYSLVDFHTPQVPGQKPRAYEGKLGHGAVFREPATSPGPFRIATALRPVGNTGLPLKWALLRPKGGSTNGIEIPLFGDPSGTDFVRG